MANMTRGDKRPNWNGGSYITSHGYRMVSAPSHPRAKRGRYVQEHILVAEKALGRLLPPGVVVHHRDENKLNNAGDNLVICENAGYHRLIHGRITVLKAGGDPAIDGYCNTCKSVKPVSEFAKMAKGFTGRQSRCRPCNTAYARAKRGSRMRIWGYRASAKHREEQAAAMIQARRKQS